MSEHSNFGSALDAHFARMEDDHCREPDYCHDCDHFEGECTCEYSITDRKEDAIVSQYESASADRQAAAEDAAFNDEVQWEVQ